jgi:hypothetical protein
MTQAEKIGQLSQGVVRGESEITAHLESIRSGEVGSYILGLGLDDRGVETSYRRLRSKNRASAFP